MRRRDRDGRTDGGVGMGAYAAAVAAVVIIGLGLLAYLFRQPLLFPSIGPTVMVLAERPRSASAHPRNVLVGHAVGVGAGLLALVAFGLTGHHSVLADGVTLPRAGAAVMSVALTTFVLQVVRAPHSPAGATTLIVSLGLLTSGRAMIAIMVAIAFVTVVAGLGNLVTGARTDLGGNDDRAR